MSSGVTFMRSTGGQGRSQEQRNGDAPAAAEDRFDAVCRIAKDLFQVRSAHVAFDIGRDLAAKPEQPDLWSTTIDRGGADVAGVRGASFRVSAALVDGRARVIGALVIEDDQPRRFTTAQTRQLEDLAR